MRLLLLAGCAAMALSPSAAALQQGDPLEEILACRQIADEAARLQCFDAASGVLQGARDSGDVAVVSRGDVEAVERDTFGLDLPSLPRLNLSLLTRNQTPRPNPLGPDTTVSPAASGAPAPAASASAASPDDASNGVRVVERDDDGSVERVVMVIDRIEQYDYNKYLFYMENGQVWRQVDTIRVRLRRGQVNEAEIRQAALESYLLRINGRGQAIRVVRDR
tara:strand:+ start:4504 stop:5166 length:663 start_codon:yes stop_codon:yes gene_type:complete